MVLEAVQDAPPTAWCKGNSCQNSIWKALYALLFKRNGIIIEEVSWW